MTDMKEKSNHWNDESMEWLHSEKKELRRWQRELKLIAKILDKAEEK